MATHIADIPKPFYCYVQNEFLFDHESGFGEFTECMVFGLSSLPSRAWGFSILLKNGSLVQHIPLHALTFNAPAIHTHPLDHLQIWSCYGYDFVTHEYDALSELPVKVYLKNNIWETGRYMFTAAPYNDHYSLNPDQHKHFNFIQLDCGRIGAYPGNRLCVFDSSFVEAPEKRPKYLTNTRFWYIEDFEADSVFDDNITPETSL